MPLMTAPSTGIKVRMYRQGHGDCFLLATRKRNGKPFYMLIDCGYKPKSEVPDRNGKKQKIDKVIKDIGDSTGNHLDAVLITHEHQDHVNGFMAKPPRARTKRCWDDIRVDRLWLAWTEDGSDRFANTLRRRFDDTLIGLLGATKKLRELPANDQARQESIDRIRELLALEIGEDEIDPVVDDLGNAPADLAFDDFAAGSIKGITNKKAMKYMRDKAEHGCLFLRPDRGPFFFKEVDGIKVYPFGPPRRTKDLLSLEPKGKEEFKLGLDGEARALFGAVASGDNSDSSRPFSPRYGRSADSVEQGPLPQEQKTAASYQYWRDFYYREGTSEWRKIDEDWLGAAEGLAMRLNKEVNNTSLAIAIELPNTGKVLFFTGDAQRGSWKSWSRLKWEENGKTVRTKELLGRTVLYKVGHHGSHNATLNGTVDSRYANLGWMAQGQFRDEFVAMIPANTKWALSKSKPWKHPLKAIEEALHEKANGRVFRTDIAKIKKPSGTNATRWNRFKSKVKETDLYLEYTVTDS